MSSTIVLVTGGAGFIGSHVVDILAAHGYSVVVVDNLLTGRREFVNPKAHFYQADIQDISDLEQVFEAIRPDIVCHLAARVSVRESMEKPLLYAQTNVIGSLNVLELCRKYGVKKVVYSSTGGAVYGEPEYLPVDEKHPINPLDAYGASKHNAEHYFYLYQANYGLKFAVLRYSNVYGPRQDPSSEAGVVAIFIKQMLNRKQVVINGSGEQERDFVYVKDVAAANLFAIACGDDSIFNIGTGLGTTINALFAKLHTITCSEGDPIYGPAKLGEVFKIYLDIEKAKCEIPWEPRVGLDEGLEMTVEWFRKRLEGKSSSLSR